MLHLYGERVLPFDVAAARLAGKLTDNAHAAGHSPGFADIAIATTVESRSLTVLTHNLRHFAPLGDRPLRDVAMTTLRDLVFKAGRLAHQLLSGEFPLGPLGRSFEAATPRWISQFLLSRSHLSGSAH